MNRIPRKAGIVYTPVPVADAVARWAIRTAADVVLDPSVGGGVFLEQARKRLSALGARDTRRQLIGIEKHGPTARVAAQLLGEDATILSRDFMSIACNELKCDVKVVLGNPPYVRHHNLSDASVKRAAKAVAAYGLGRTGNYWAYFVLQSIQLVAPGGRLALVLPGSVVHGGYSGVVRRAVQSWFCRVTAIFVDECVFPGVEEETVILLADTRRFAAENESEVRIGTQSVGSLSFDEERLCRETRVVRPDEAWMRGLLSESERVVFSSFAERCELLSRLTKVRIGTVTGANRFFIRPGAERDVLPIDCWRELISKTAHVRGIRLSADDVSDLSDEGARLFAADVSGASLSSSRVRRFIADGEALGIDKRTKCAERQPWYAVHFTDPPDAFLTYMNGGSPAVVVNETELSSTNTLHNLYMKKDRSARALAVGFQTTLSQLAAELEGRAYGGGVLKLEPSEACRIPVPMPRVRGADVDRLDALRRSGVDGQALANTICFGRGDRDGVEILKAALKRLRDRRQLRHDTWRRGPGLLASSSD